LTFELKIGIPLAHGMENVYANFDVSAFLFFELRDRTKQADGQGA